MEALLRRRIASRGWVTREVRHLEKICEKDLTELSEQIFRDGLEQLEVRMKALDLIQSEVEAVIEMDQLDNDIEEACQFRDSYRAVKVRAETMLKLLCPSDQRQPVEESAEHSIDSFQIVHGSNGRVPNARLPKLEIPSFHGDILQWQSFYDQFVAAVHNQNISPVTKFSYLRSCLRGEALACINGLSLTESNYVLALDVLQKRFGRKEKIIFTHIQSLLNLKVDDNLWSLYDTLQIHIRQLESLGVDGGSYGVILTPMILSKIPAALRMEWARLGEGKESDLSFLLNFLYDEINRRERAHMFKSEKNQRDTRPKGFATASALYTSTDVFCHLCKKHNHSVDKCKNLIQLPIEEKKNVFRKAGLCFKCLRSGHLLKACKSKEKCRVCGGDHHYLLCFKTKDSNPKIGQTSKVANLAHVARVPDEQIEDSKTHAVLTNNSSIDTPTSYLQMARIRTYGSKRGKEIKANVIFDSGSDRSYISSDFAKKLRPKFIGTEGVSFVSFGSNKPSELQCRNVYGINFITLNGDFEYINVIETPVISTVTSRPKFPCQIFDLVRDLDMVDDCFVDRNGQIEIDVLIGLDYFWTFFNKEVKELTPTLSAQSTKFGWMISGSLCYRDGNQVSTFNQLFCQNLSDDHFIKFWDLETIGIKESDDCVENDTLREFNENITFHNGKYEVSLPWKEGKKNSLTNNKEIASLRLRSLSKRLERDPKLKSLYNKALEEMESNGVIHEVPENEVSTSNAVFYMPHRPVVKLDSATTKIRPVFDASAKDINGISLNDCLHRGPNMYPNLIEILIRFRRWKFALSADITKAFLQVKLKEQDRDVHRFLWDHNGKRREMRFERVTFGVVCSPFLLNATIKYHLSQYPEERVVSELKNNLYVDDLLTGNDSEDNLSDMIDQIYQIMKKAGFVFCKWGSNSQLVPTRVVKNILCQDDPSPEIKVLGLKWLSSEDCFIFDAFSLSEGLIMTKRMLLSFLARIFDPLGFISPFIMFGRIIFQKLWLQGIGWDETLDKSLQKQSLEWISGLQRLSQWKIPRWFFHKTNILWSKLESIHLHCFCDASQQGYGCVVYLVASDGQSTTKSFVMSKARVAPVKKLTLARLELLGCLLAVRLLKFLRNAFSFNENTCIQYTCWSDSKIALAWIRGDCNRWKQFVSNRVREIQSCTSPSNWRFCKGSENPADLMTRGKLAKDLIESRIWLEGPEWLFEVSTHKGGPKETESLDDETLDIVHEEEKQSFQVALTTETLTKPLLEYKRYSDFNKISNILGWVLRFLNNIKTQNSKLLGKTLTSEERETAKLKLFSLLQKEHFGKEIEALERKNAISRGSPIQKLNPFIDSDGLLKVNGRLKFAKLSYDERHPIILPKCHLTYLMVLFQHLLMKHNGVESIVTTLRHSYWILGLRVMAKKVCRTCIACQRFDSRPCSQPTAPLPQDRVNRAQPFAVVGIDYCGPIYCVDTAGKKLYILLTTCAVLRCIDLQITDSLSFKDFILAYRRFCARRGLPSIIYSDNFSTFKNASKFLETKYKHLSPTWKFNVPLAPWYGGWFERLVRSVKSAIKKSVGTKSLMRSEMETVLQEIEACINSRPLTYTGNEIESTPITPARFLIGRTSFYHAPSKVSELSLSRNEIISRSILQDQVIEYFWSLWSDIYIRNLPTPKSSKAKCDLEVGSIVLVQDKQTSRLNWPVAVVTELKKGRDGKVRSVELRTNKGRFVRAIQSLHKLEICDRLGVSIEREHLNYDRTEDNPETDIVSKDKDMQTDLQTQNSLTKTSRYGRCIKKPDVLSL